MAALTKRKKNAREKVDSTKAYLIEDALTSGALIGILNLPPAETGYFLLTTGRPTPAAAAFIDWMLKLAARASNEGIADSG